MKIEVNKNELERALIALGKLISRMSPIPEHKSLLIELRLAPKTGQLDLV